MSNSNVSGSIPQNIKKYVHNGTVIVNIVFFLCQICFGLMFWKYNADVLLYYNLFSWVLFAFNCTMLKLGKIKIYIFSTFAGILGLMILSVIYLGWDFGFQHYCIGFIASGIFTDFYMNRARKISKRTFGNVAFYVLLYVALRLWTYEHPYVYEIDNVWLTRGFYLINSLLGFSFLITYSLIYSNTVRRLESSLREMANIDPLTGICNRRKMHQILKNSLEQKENIIYRATVAMLDVDFFKKVNDTYGHDAGDEVLLMLAHLLYDKQEKTDGFYVSRWGGEEFLIFYEKYNLDNEEILQQFDLLRKEIEDVVVRVNNKEIKITVTIGVSFYEKGETIQKLIKTADDNLYKGKSSGRNKVVS